MTHDEVEHYLFGTQPPREGWDQPADNPDLSKEVEVQRSAVLSEIEQWERWASRRLRSRS